MTCIQSKSCHAPTVQRNVSPEKKTACLRVFSGLPARLIQNAPTKGTSTRISSQGKCKSLMQSLLKKLDLGDVCSSGESCPPRENRSSGAPANRTIERIA